MSRSSWSNEVSVRAWAKESGVELAADVASDERVRGLIRAEIEKLGAEFKSFERPRDFLFIRDDFTIDNGLLTPTLKLKRRGVLASYGAELEALYERAAPPSPAPRARRRPH